MQKTMKNQIVEEKPNEEQEEEYGEIKKTSNNGLGNHLGPKTKETELRLGFSSVNSGFGQEKCGKRLITSDHDDEMLRRGFVVNKQRNNGCGGFGTTTTTTTKLIRRCSEIAEDGNPLNSSSNPKQEKAVFQSSDPLPRAPPVVGWPPVRAFRRNLSSPSKPDMESKFTTVSSDEVVSNKSTKDSMYVKVNMEGYAVGRKINLKAHNCYESLSQALQKMFDNFLSVNYSKSQEKAEEVEEVRTTKHVLIYEDNEGDRILVGDVPWEMFITTVKRLHIISGSRAPAIVHGWKGGENS